MKEYMPRIVDSILRLKLETSGAVNIKGPMWCGKTTTARQQSASVILMDEPGERERNRAMATSFPREFLSQDAPLLIDEWQTVPSLWDAVRHEVDRRDEFGQFILTGSTSPLEEDEEEKILHSGTGRIATLRMRPMSSFESGFSNGKLSLSRLFANNRQYIDADSSRSIEDVAVSICRGGWPRGITLSDNLALELPYNFLGELITSKRIREHNGRKSPQDVERLLRSYARNVSTQASRSILAKDMGNGGGKAFSDETLRDYLAILEKLYITEDLSAWNPNIRSSYAIQSSPTRHFCDPSIGIASLGLDPSSLNDDLQSFGLFFESMCIRDLRTYAEALKGKLFHYRDSSGLETDAVMVLRNGSWAAIEIKLAGEEGIAQGARNLLKLADRIDQKSMKAPSFLMVVTAKRHAYLRDDGVWEAPISVLAP